MSEKEKRIIETFAEALPRMTDYEKGYFMGRAEGMLQDKNKKQEEENIKTEES